MKLVNMMQNKQPEAGYSWKPWDEPVAVLRAYSSAKMGLNSGTEYPVSL